MQLQEAIGVVKAEVQRRIQLLQEMDGCLAWLGSQQAAAAESASPPATAVMQASAERPREDVSTTLPSPWPADGGRRSKWYEPVGKALASGPKGLSELERAVGVAPPSFMSTVLQKYVHLFRKNGSGRGSTWELTEAGKREFCEGKA